MSKANIRIPLDVVASNIRYADRRLGLHWQVPHVNMLYPFATKGHCTLRVQLIVLLVTTRRISGQGYYCIFVIFNYLTRKY